MHRFVFAGDGNGSRVVWIADLLPDDMQGPIEAMMEEGMAVMKRTLDRLADEVRS
jgi:hypothetical protein